VLEEFISGGASSTPGDISPTLFQDLIALALKLSENMVSSPEEMRQLIGVVKKEPQLMLRIIGATDEREREFADVIARREGVAPDHPVVQMAVVLLANIARKTSLTFFSEGNTRSYPELLLANVSAARQLFTQNFTEPVSAKGQQ
jgi:hypothetical protein